MDETKPEWYIAFEEWLPKPEWKDHIQIQGGRSFAVMDDLVDFFGALLESGHDLEEAFQGVRDLASGEFGSINQVEAPTRRLT